MTPDPHARGLDADEVVDRLWQGSEPSRGIAVRDAGFDVLALCAQEIQQGPFPGVTVLRFSFDDDEEDHAITTLERLRAQAAASQVAAYYRAGMNVLVTCAAGKNRSGLVTALALNLLFGWPGKRCIEAVRKARGRDALGNDSFVEVLERIK